MRVLYCTAYPKRMAGANRSMFELVTNLPRTVDPVVMVSAEGPVAAAYRRAGVECLVVPPPPPLDEYGGRLREPSRSDLVRGARALLWLSFSVRRVLKDRRIDLLHVNDVRGALQVALGAWLARVPVVQHLRGEFCLGPITRRAFEISARRIIAVSHGVRETLTPRGYQKAVVVYNGIGPLRPSSWESRYLAKLKDTGVQIVSCFASVVPFKGLHHLAEAMAELNDLGWRGKFAVICVGDFVEGYENYQAWLLKRAEVLRIDNLTFTGWVDDPTGFYKYADICVLPSVSNETLDYGEDRALVRGGEGFPRTHLEAMAAGRPVVGTRIAGVPEQVEHEVTGLVVEPGDPHALALALERLFADPCSARRMGERGSARVQQRFSTESYVAGVVEVYKTVVSTR